MILVTSNKPKQLVLLSFVGEVRAEELAQGLRDLEQMLAELSPGFRLITDLSSLEIIREKGIQEITKAMELCNQRGVGLVVRVIPDPAKDIGFNILSAFHYVERPRIVTCKSMIEAARLLEL